MSEYNVKSCWKERFKEEKKIGQKKTNKISQKTDANIHNHQMPNGLYFASILNF